MRPSLTDHTHSASRGPTDGPPYPGCLVVSLGLVVAVADMARADNIGASGDISNVPGGGRGDTQTARLLDRASGNGIGLVLPLGDLQYEVGSLAAFQGAYDLSWGRHKAISRPVPGNHEYGTPGAAGYYTYWAGQTPAHPGFYKFTWQGWEFFVINTTFDAMSTAERASQLAWFKQAMSSSTARCQVVLGHHPYRATSSPHAGEPRIKEYWPYMVNAGVDLYLSGHNHSFETGRPIRTQGNVDETTAGGDGKMGVRWVVAGLGGRSIIGFSGTPTPSSLFRYVGSYGVFKIVPDYPSAGRWVQAFKTVGGGTLDRRAYGCH